MSNIFLDYEEVKQQIINSKTQEIQILQEQVKKYQETIADFKDQLAKK